MIRKIWLTDKDNINKFDFSDFGNFIFTAPTNLGIYREQEFLMINTQRILVNDVPKYNDITGVVLIKSANKDLEKKYAELRDFISKNIKKGFRLYVQTQKEVQARYINCNIRSLDKSEKSTANTMLIPIIISPQSLWLGDVSGVTTVQNILVEGIFQFTQKDENGGIYAVQFKERENSLYSIAFSSGQISQVILANNGEESSALKIRIEGEAVNPLIRLINSETNDTIQSVKFNNLIVPENYSLEINSDPLNTYIELINNATNERIDVEQYADENSNIYLNIPVGSYTIQASDDTETNIVQTKILFSEQYKGA